MSCRRSGGATVRCVHEARCAESTGESMRLRATNPPRVARGAIAAAIKARSTAIPRCGLTRSDHPGHVGGMIKQEPSTVLITGASSGIGAACADRFAAHGYRLVLCARRYDRLARNAEALRARHGVDIHAFELDVRDAAAVERGIGALPTEFAAIDVLVNNAGLSRGLDPAYANAVDHIDDMVDTNVKGLLYVTRAVVPGMLERGRGHVVNIGSTAGHEVYRGGTVYAATKHAVGAITRGLKMDLHGTPIPVSTVHPGLTATDFPLRPLACAP